MRYIISDWKNPKDYELPFSQYDPQEASEKQKSVQVDGAQLTYPIDKLKAGVQVTREDLHDIMMTYGSNPLKWKEIWPLIEKAQAEGRIIQTYEDQDQEKPGANDSSQLYFWLWQFLRRNSDYQKEWGEEYSHYLEKGGRPLEAMEEIEQAFFKIYSRGSEKWFISAYIAPSNTSPWNIEWGTWIGKVYFNHIFDRMFLPDDEVRGPGNIPEGGVAILFDLNIDIKYQIDKICSVFNDLQQRYPSRKKIFTMPARLPKKSKNTILDQVNIDDYALWKRYLRVFDAKVQGVGEKEITSELFPLSNETDYDNKIRQVRDDYKRAKELIGGDYRRYIVAMKKP